MKNINTFFKDKQAFLTGWNESKASIEDPLF